MIASIQDILRSWELGPQLIVASQVAPKVWRVKSGGKVFYLKRRGNTHPWGPSDELELAAYLNGKGIAVESPLLTRACQPALRVGEKSYLLYEALEGEPLKEPTLSSLTAIGAHLSALHVHLDKYPGQSIVSRWEIERHTRQWVDECGHPPIGKWAREVLLELKGKMGRYSELPCQLVHSDLNKGNILMKGGRVTGLIDFERVRKAPRIADIGYFLAGRLKEGNVPASSGSVAAFLKGYEGAGAALTPEERRLLPYVILTFLLQYTLFYYDRGCFSLGSVLTTIVEDFLGTGVISIK
ncbi:phosphotransferase enzyme family protein [Bacillus sp. KH172YL63]|uniref:phosphotransferase enzyme family protein n=1 Tax=Bacillus sp. KH172YL63 TaxID=2709784 RepID=UPI0013E41F21|nr:phosphotransferase [Bacillus sp. KH172YL63]BCB02865.1 hypothetical protein KH172YL63_09980 [Bacillus sp. KH172YL63]